MQIGLCQVDSQWEDRLKTRDRITNMLRHWGGKTDCLIFPEMVLSGFSMDLEKSTLDSSDHEFFALISGDQNATVIYGGVDNGYNCIFQARVDQKKPTVLYRKRHLFSYGGEQKTYKAGEESLIFEFGGMKFSLAICYDLRFPYQFWRNAKECDGYILIASWPESRKEHWQTLLKARAIENQAFFIGVNRVGSDPKLNYSGDSAVYGPFGEKRLDCGLKEGVYTCDIDKTETEDIRKRFSFLEDRQQ